MRAPRSTLNISSWLAASQRAGLIVLILVVRLSSAQAGQFLECVFAKTPYLQQTEHAHALTPYQGFVSMLNAPGPEIMSYHWQDELFAKPEDQLLPFFRAAMHFSVHERVQALRKINESIIPTKAKNVLKVAMYDEAIWRRDFWQYAQFAYDHEMNRHAVWLELISNMPQALSLKIKQDIKRDYANYSKEAREYPGLVDHDINGPKRGVDAYLQQTTRDANLFTAFVAEGLSPWNAYVRTIEQMRRTFFPTRKLGNYPSQFTFDIAEQIQTILQRDHAHEAPVEIIFAGSTVNGRAKFPESDLDLLYSGSLPERERDNLVWEIKSHLRSQNLKPEFMPDFFFSEQLGLYNPFQLRITQNAIELLVYKPSRNDTHFQKPDVYRLR